MMPFAVYHKENDLQEVVYRLYELKGRGARALAVKAGLALLEANPELKNLSKMPPGVVLAVPPVSNLKFTEEVWPVEIAEAALRACEALDAYQLQYQEDGRTLELLRLRLVRRAVSKKPAMENQLDGVIEAIKSRRKETRNVIRELVKEGKRLSKPGR